MTNTQFVTELYWVSMQRTPDTDGLNHWVSLLDGGESRGAVTQEIIGAILNYTGADASAPNSRRDAADDRQRGR